MDAWLQHKKRHSRIKRPCLPIYDHIFVFINYKTLPHAGIKGL